MKKFFITLLILIILATAGFMFGWVQFAVPPGKFGVIHSKSHGIDDQLVRSGEFRWVWYKLIPTNVKIAVFSLERRTFPISFDSALPTGDVYASFAGLSNVNFAWDLRGEIGFNIDPNHLVRLTKTHNLAGQEDFDNYLQSVAQEIELIILRELSTAALHDDRLELILSGNNDTQMETAIKTRFPETTDFSLVIHSAKFPNFILYRQLRLLYEDFMERQRDVIASTFAERAQSHIQAQLRLDELAQYGDLLTRFPVLLEYLIIEGNLANNRNP